MTRQEEWEVGGATTSDGCFCYSGGNNIIGRTADDIGSAIRVWLNSQRFGAVNPELERLVVQRAYKLTRACSIADGLPKVRRRQPTQRNSVHIGQSAAIPEYGAGKAV